MPGFGLVAYSCENRPTGRFHSTHGGRGDATPMTRRGAGKGQEMPDNTANMQEQTPQGGAADKEFQPVSTQAELDRIIGERIARERAKYAGYAEFKAKAAKFDEMEQAGKSELEKANDRADVQPVPRDIDALYNEIVRRLPASLGKKFDATEFFGTAPGSNFDTLAGSCAGSCWQGR